jgi:hypothetical protein
MEVDCWRGRQQQQAEFFTATILNWQKLLQDDFFKQI